MRNFVKNGRVVVVLNGRYAGRKAVVLRSFSDGTSERPYSHAIVAGIDTYPKIITRAMNKDKVKKRSRIKPFVKAVNMNHLFFTRFVIDLKFDKSVVCDKNLKKSSKKGAIRHSVKQSFTKKFLTGDNKFFFTKLRF